MAERSDLFNPLARALDQMGRDLGQGIDGAVSRAVHGLGRSGAAPPSADDFTADDRQILDRVEEYLSRGLDLDRWWRAALAANSFEDRFELGRTFNEPSRSFGFFDHAPVAGRSQAVMGNFQEMFYDQPKSPRDGQVDAARRMRDQMREFVLRYFMRVSDFREPAGYSELERHPSSRWPELLSWCPREDVALKGFGFQQLYYKRSATGEIGKFPDAERFAIVDLREIGRTYDWIVVKVCIFDFNFQFRPFGSGNPQIVVPLQEDSFLVLTRDFIQERDDPEPGLLGRYGLGYAFIKNPTQGALAFGPGEFDAAIERIDFEVRETGQTRVAMSFVANRPERLVNFSFDPFGLGLRMADFASLGFLKPLWEALEEVPRPRLELDPVYTYVDLMNLLTGGAAAEELCISRDQLDREFLVKHFMQHYQAVAGSLATWRLVRDWLDTASLPGWAIHGRSFG